MRSRATPTPYCGLVLLFVSTSLQAEPDPLVQGETEFAIALYRQLSAGEPNKNLFFSPYSISRTLGIAAEGAAGRTKREILRTLSRPAGDAGDAEARQAHARLLMPTRDNSAEAVARREGIARLREELLRIREELGAELDYIYGREHRWRGRARGPVATPWGLRYRDETPRLHRLEGAERRIVRRMNALFKEAEPYKLKIANAIWLTTQAHLRPGFGARVAEIYGGDPARQADFRNDVEGVRRRINAWVAEQTDSVIPSLLGVGDIDAETRLMITDAICFRGTWQRPFLRGATKPRDFFRRDGEQPHKVATMHREGMTACRYGAFERDGTVFKTPYRYREDEPPPFYPGPGGLTMLELPYKGGEISMVVLVPTKISGLAEIEATLSGAKLTRWIAQLKQRKTHVYLPKFKASHRYELDAALVALGMDSAFKDPRLLGGANFSGITRNFLFQLTGMVHQAAVNVDEDGTKAVSVTSMQFFGIPASAPPRWLTFTPTFRADRPFLFLIRHRESGSVLFLGRVMKP